MQYVLPLSPKKGARRGQSSTTTADGLMRYTTARSSSGGERRKQEYPPKPPPKTASQITRDDELWDDDDDAGGGGGGAAAPARKRAGGRQGKAGEGAKGGKPNPNSNPLAAVMDGGYSSGADSDAADDDTLYPNIPNFEEVRTARVHLKSNARR